MIWAKVVHKLAIQLLNCNLHIVHCELYKQNLAAMQHSITSLVKMSDSTYTNVICDGMSHSKLANLTPQSQYFGHLLLKLRGLLAIVCKMVSKG